MSCRKRTIFTPQATFWALLARIQRYKKSRNIAPSALQMQGYSVKTGVETAFGGALRGRKQEKIKKIGRKFARFEKLSLYLHSQLERCRSGRSGRTRNAVNGQLFRGFESLSLRKGHDSPNDLCLCRGFFMQIGHREFTRWVSYLRKKGTP